MIRPRRNWTAEEDVILKKEVRRVQAEGDNISWHEIAAFLPGRTNKDCRKRWYGTAAAKVKKGPWTEAEDDRLRRAIDRHGTKWAVVASVVGTRLPDQCSKRWSHAINPTIDHSPWTEREDELLMHTVHKHGHYWQQIVSMYFPGRTSLAAKNRYHIIQRRLKGEGGVVARVPALDGLMEASSWQEMLCFDTSGSSVQDISSAATPKESTFSLTQDTETPCVSLASQPTIYDHAMQFDIEPAAYPFSRVETIDDREMAFNGTFPSTISVDDLVFQSTLSPTTTNSSSSSSSYTTTPSFSPIPPPGASSMAENKPDTSQRRICIQAVCSTDKLGAIFEAVTKFSISAVIKTDD
ncbi:hypothetical protein BJX70DRAFT_392424 [Aspergillus crustosus]